MPKLKLFFPIAFGVASVLLSSDLASAKGGADNPTVVLIDPTGNTVKLDQAGAANDVDVVNEVEIKNSAGAALPVVIQNGAGAPVPVDVGLSPRVPFQAYLNSTGFKFSHNLSFEVPAGEILVIEHISARVEEWQDVEDLSRIFVVVRTGGVEGVWHLPATERQKTSGPRVFIVSESLRLYADPGSEVQYTAIVGPVGTAEMFTEVSFSGYLIPAGEPSLSP